MKAFYKGRAPRPVLVDRACAASSLSPQGLEWWEILVHQKSCPPGLENGALMHNKISLKPGHEVPALSLIFIFVLFLRGNQILVSSWHLNLKEVLMAHVKINTYNSIYELQTKLIAFTTVFMCKNMVAHLPEISSQNWRRPPSYYMGQLLRTWFGRVNYLISNQIIIIIIIIDVWNITHQ